MIGMIVFFVMIISIVCIVQPEIFWSIRDGWREVDTEINDNFLLVARIIGVFSMIILMFFMFSSCGT